MNLINELPFCEVNKKLYPSPSLILHGLLSEYRSDASMSDSELAEFICNVFSIYMDNNDLSIIHKKNIKTGNFILLFEDGQNNR